MTIAIGQPLLRKEDYRFLTGTGRYSDDVSLPGQVYAALARSPHAHARIGAIETEAARAMPGVLAVLTGADAVADGLKPIPHLLTASGPPADILLNNRDGLPHKVAPQEVLAVDRVRFVGAPVVVVVAETLDQAKQAAECVEVEYELLPPVIVTRAAAEPATPTLYDTVPNVCVDADVGDAAATESAFAQAAHVTRLDAWVQRVTGVPMDARAMVAEYDAASGRYTLYAGGGGVVRQRRELAHVLDVPPERARVVSYDIGGNFGTKNAFYPEMALVAWAAKRLGRPVKWTCERHEAFLTDYQGRDQAFEAELALDGEGRFLAMRGSIVLNVGAHSVMYVPLVKCVQIITGVYRVPAAQFRCRAVLSNTPPTSPYRSAGRPEAMFVIERLIDMAARETGRDPVELRRLNIIPPHAPYPNAVGLTYDTCAHEAVMDQALALSDWNGFAARKAESLRCGKLRGIGLANYIEATSGAPREWTDITVHPEGRVDMAIGTMSSGQGHETSFTQLVADWLGVPFEKIQLRQGDTDFVPVGGGSHSARSMRMGSIVIGKASDAIIAKGMRIAAHVMEADAADIAFANGRFTVAGTDRSVGIFDVAKAARERDDLPEDLRGRLNGESDEITRTAGFPYGTAVCEVEIDPDTGAIEIVRYTAIDDVGIAVNPLILHGQTHGAIAQGVGQALWEHCVYDPASGQCLSASFMDYAMPRADTLPSFATGLSEVPAPSNPHGIRGGGEGGTTPALAVVVNSVVDALAEYGVTHMEMPVTPEKIWRAIRNGKAAPQRQERKRYG